LDHAINSIEDTTYIKEEKLVNVFLKSTYFIFKENIYEQIHGIAIGSPLSPIVPNIYMDKFEVRGFNSFPLTLGVWK
jgi:hypothetical protein